VINNGSAGLGNFADTSYGVITRLSSDPQPPADSLYGMTLGTLRCDAVPVRFDLHAWKARFLAQWLPAALAMTTTSRGSTVAPRCGCTRPPAAAWSWRPATPERRSTMSG
jgi:hypothetical protein